MIKHRRLVLRILYPKQHNINCVVQVDILGQVHFAFDIPVYTIIVSSLNSGLIFNTIMYYVSVVARSLVSDVSFWSGEFLITSPDYTLFV